MLLPVSPSFDLSNRRSLVTGGGRGIGMASAVALADAGSDVTIIARTSEQIDAVAKELRSQGKTCTAFSLDITRHEALGEFIKAQEPFQILVNAAGMAIHKDMLDTTYDDYDTVSDLNIKSAYFICQHVSKKLLEANLSGSLINISSQMGLVGGLKRSLYCATKHAIEGFTKAIAWELGKHNIRINTICPTFIKTELTQKAFEDPDTMDWILSKIALGRTGEINEIMGAVVFLASDASSLVTGTSLVVDGGWTAS